ncbi:hypothetical protein B0I35DRAFT_443098 [Stachybotrys elegans]|uniref:Uncharacterized protein n=1 Tax=Stachybotrys elegans TaxID=80388 RepID=A0A8K0WKW7_9HYPO|nr:hypothetical protein B0I35DRAFT_443098 [Stachybotrys elegans]
MTRRQYEVNGSTETHDPSVPSTTACPYLPGQTVNMMTVPVERTLRKRSASMNSMRGENFKTMDPESKFATLRPTRRAPTESRFLRLASPPARLRNKASSRSLSPAPGWKRFFSLKFSNHEDVPLPPAPVPNEQYDVSYVAHAPAPAPRESRSASPFSDGGRTRDLSPESLRRFLMSDELPAQPEPVAADRPSLIIPEDIAEENDDDDNFAVSPRSEIESYPTCLSPPPFNRKRTSPAATRSGSPNSSFRTVMPARPSSQPHKREHHLNERYSSSSLPRLMTSHLHPTSAPHSVMTTPHSPVSTSDELNSIYDSNDEDDNMHWRPLPPVPRAIEGYSLPRQADDKMAKPHPTLATTLVSRDNSASSLLSTPIKTSIDDFANELNWVVEAISSKHN